MTTRAPLRLGFLSTHLIQYFSPLYRHLARRVDGFEVAYYRGVERKGGALPIYDPAFGRMVAWDVDLLGGYEFDSFGLADAPFTYTVADYARLASGARRWYGRFRPDVVVVPGWTAPHVVAARALHGCGARIVFRPDARVPRGGSLVRAVARDACLRVVLRMASSFACFSTGAREELMRLGVPSDRLVHSPFVIDTDLWRPALEAAHADRERHRAELGLAPDDVAYLYVGKLQDIKRVRELIDLFVALLDRVPAARLMLVGDGELRAELEARVEAAGKASRIHFFGFANQSELPRFYAAADVFTLVSIETWGLVVNEAMLAGLPLAVSVDAGCLKDLVADGVTGLRLYVDDPPQVVDALARLADPELRASMRPALARLAERYTLEASAEGIVHAATLALESPA